MSDDSPTPDITSIDSAKSLSIPEAAVEFAQILAFEALVSDLVKARRAALTNRLNIAHAETGGKTYQARADNGEVMADFTIKESKAAYTIADRDAFTDWVIDNHGTEVTMTAAVTDQDAFLDWVRENSPEWAKVTVSVKPAYEKVFLSGKTLTRDDDAIIEKDTGLLVEGVKYTPAHSTGQFGTSWKDNGKETAAQSVIAGAADRLLSGFLAETAGELEAGAQDPAA